MHKIIQRLLLHESFEIKTKLSASEAAKRLGSFTAPQYYGAVEGDKFYIGVNPTQSFLLGYTKNSFAPIAKGAITEKDGITIISGVFRMNIFVQILLLIIYLSTFFFIYFVFIVYI